MEAIILFLIVGYQILNSIWIGKLESRSDEILAELKKLNNEH